MTLVLTNNGWERQLSNTQCAAVARQMAHEIATRGHTVGTYQERGGQVCLLGALSYSSPMVTEIRQYGRPTISFEAMRQAFSQRFVQYLYNNYPLGEEYVPAHTWPDGLGTAPSTMAMWNDNILKTGEETIAWLHKFADAADAAPAGAPVTEW